MQQRVVNVSRFIIVALLLTFASLAEAQVTWTSNGTTINNPNSGNVDVTTTLSVGFPSGYANTLPLFVSGTGVNVGGNFWYVGRFNDPTTGKGPLFGYDSGNGYSILGATSASKGFELWTHNGTAWGERMRLDGNGVLGLGNTSLPVWEPTYRVLHLGTSAVIAGRSNGTGLELGDNFYRDSSAIYRYSAAGTANLLSASNGAWNFVTAGSGAANGSITWATPFSIENLTGIAPGKVRITGSSNTSGVDSGQLAFANDGTGGIGGILGRIRVAPYTATSGKMFFETRSSGASGAEVFSPAMTIDSSGNVGIGHSPASGRLDVKGALWIESASTDHAIRILPGTAGGSHLIESNYVSGGLLPLRLTANSPSFPNQVYLDTNGNVGIGTVPAFRLDVGGSAGFRNPGDAIDVVGQPGSPAYVLIDQTANGGKKWRIGHTGSAAGFTSFDIQNQTDNVTALSIAANGSVGIGVAATNVASLLEVRGAAGPNTTRIGGDGSAIDKAYGVTQILTDSTLPTAINTFYTNHSNNARGNELFRIHSGETLAGATAFRVTTGGTVSAPAKNALVVNSASGNVGIGVVPAASGATAFALDVNNSGNNGFRISNPGGAGVEISNFASTGANRIISYNRSSGGYQDLFFGTTNSENTLYLGSSGNVGVGTTPSSERLTIDGYVKATGFKLADGTLVTGGASSASNVTPGTFANGDYTFQASLGVSGSLGIGLPKTTANLLSIRDATAGTVTSPVASWIGAKVERSGDTAAAGIALQGGSRATNGVGRLYLGNADEWDSTYVEGGNRKLSVWIRTGTDGAGNATFANALSINTQGDLRVQGNIEAKYQDVAEWVSSGGQILPGTVVIINPDRYNEVVPSLHAYDTSVAGVVSGQPGLLLGEGGADKSKIATTGRVRVRVDATRHSVKAGDLLVTSDKPGVAMVSEPLDIGGVKIHRPGTLIGKALEPLANGEGEVLVLLSLQ